MLQTRGNQWLRKYHPGRAWCKAITSLRDIDLQQEGGYALQTAFLDFDANVLLHPAEYLVIARENIRGASNVWFYRYALITNKFAIGVQHLMLIPDCDLREAYRAARHASFMLNDHNNNPSPLYMMAVYVYMAHMQLLDKLDLQGGVLTSKTAVGTGDMPAESIILRPRRMIDRPNAKKELPEQDLRLDRGKQPTITDSVIVPRGTNFWTCATCKKAGPMVVADDRLDLPYLCPECSTDDGKSVADLPECEEFT